MAGRRREPEWLAEVRETGRRLLAAYRRATAEGDEGRAEALRATLAAVDGVRADWQARAWLGRARAALGEV